jgi:peptidoglycan/xylan/chitin deacetylase (PgdA/CDA1 family)
MMVPILMYHSISHAPRPSRLRSLCVTPAKFRRQMSLLSALGYRGVSMREALPFLSDHTAAQQKIVALTFDDGYADNVEVALPVLKEWGFSATCYIVSGALGQSNEWDSPEIARKAIMTEDQVRRWHKAGMEVGAHSRTHPRHLTTLTDQLLRYEVGGSKTDLETVIGAPVTQFCYPYGDFDTRTRQAVEKSGFTGATTIVHGRARSGLDLFALPRIFIGGPNVLPVFAMKVLTAYEDMRK